MKQLIIKNKWRIIACLVSILLSISISVFVRRCNQPRNYYYVTVVIYTDHRESDTLKVLSGYQDPFFLTEGGALYIKADNPWKDGNKLLMTGVNLYRIISIKKLSEESFKELYQVS